MNRFPKIVFCPSLLSILFFLFDSTSPPLTGVIPEDMPACIERELINGGRVACPDPETVKPPTRFVHLSVCSFARPFLQLMLMYLELDAELQYL